MISSKPSAVKPPPQAVGGVREPAGVLAHEDSGSAKQGVLLEVDGDWRKDTTQAREFAPADSEPPVGPHPARPIAPQILPSAYPARLAAPL
jgi:hypothetical protein